MVGWLLICYNDWFKDDEDSDDEDDERKNTQKHFENANANEKIHFFQKSVERASAKECKVK